MHTFLFLLSAPALLATQVADSAESQFPIPEQIEGRIWFWEQVFGRYDSDQAVLHDRENPELIWHVVDLPENPNPQNQIRPSICSG
ncbi:MAG: hypothetical protein AAFY60_19640, partial [Myxococcota bacterium]